MKVLNYVTNAALYCVVSSEVAPAYWIFGKTTAGSRIQKTGLNNIGPDRLAIYGQTDLLKLYDCKFVKRHYLTTSTKKGKKKKNMNKDWIELYIVVNKYISSTSAQFYYLAQYEKINTIINKHYSFSYMPFCSPGISKKKISFFIRN